jgi:hypothetical protein
VFENIITYLTDDLMRLLYILGGSGGISYWYQLWRTRVRLRVKVIGDQTQTVSADGFVTAGVIFDCINIGRHTTSLKPEIKIRACTSISSKRYQTYVLHLEGDLMLPPHENKRFKAEAKLEADYVGAMYKAYEIRPANGFSARFNTAGKAHKIRRNRLVRDWLCFRYRYFGKTVVS